VRPGRRARRRGRLARVLATALAVLAPHAAAEEAPKTLEDWVRTGNRHQLAGDYDSADATWRAMREQFPGHPAPDAMAVDTLFWRQMYDDSTDRYDADIERLADRAVAQGEEALEEAPDDAALRLYTGKAFMQLGRLHGTRGRYYRAGTLGEKGRVHLEAAHALAPENVDARYQLGLYYYYASFVPGLVKWLDFLWFVPTGNGDEGLELLALVAERGDLERDNARFILSNIETYHLENPTRGLELLTKLHADYPTNTMIHFELLEALYMLGQYERARDEALALERNPRTGALHQGRKTMARVWRARAVLALDRPEQALDALAPLVAQEPEVPLWGKAWVRLTQGNALDALGRREEALDRYAAVESLEAPYVSRRAAKRARASIEAPYRVAPPLSIGAAPEPGRREPIVPAANGPS